MPSRLEITFDGLFVFVNRAAPRVMYVLMAETNTPHPHPGHPVHLGWITVSGHARTRFGVDLDLSRVPGLIGGSAIMQNGLPLSRVTKAPPPARDHFVEERFLTGGFQQARGSLAGRIVLPAPRAIQVETSVAVAYENGGAWTNIDDRRVTGKITAIYEVDRSVTIGGFGTIPATGGSIYFEHLPQTPAPPPPGGYYQAPTQLRHAGMHGPLFRRGIPTFQTTEDYYPPPAHGIRPLGVPVPGVDPVVCTMGQGCPPENPDCSDG